MNNLKIRVENEVDENKVIDLFEQLGGEVHWYSRYSFPKWIVLSPKGGISDFRLSKSHWYAFNPKEITLPQLRDLVVLKRNDKSDATHQNKETSTVYYITSDSKYYYFNPSGWSESLADAVDLDGVLKPLTKEYLIKNADKYELVNEWQEGAIEVPDGAECLTECMDEGEIFKLWWKGELKVCIGYDVDWFNIERDVEDYLSDHPNAKIIWQRQAHPEELPFIDDEPSLNDQYAEIEKVREKHSHYKKDVSHLNFLDIYRVTELFKPHSCGAHIAKKALCSGQRGHKDLLTDIQDIIDTAERWKQMIQEDVNDNS